MGSYSDGTELHPLALECCLDTIDKNGSRITAHRNDICIIVLTRGA